MPRFLLITILIFVLAGHIFAVKEYAPPPIDEGISIHLEDLYFDDNYAKNNEALQIIEGPSGNTDIVNDEKLLNNEQTIFINDGESCIFFEKDGIPRVDFCPGAEIGEDTSNSSNLLKKDGANNLEDLSF
jgi:hypothetical protein